MCLCVSVLCLCRYGMYIHCFSGIRVDWVTSKTECVAIACFGMLRACTFVCDTDGARVCAHICIILFNYVYVRANGKFMTMYKHRTIATRRAVDAVHYPTVMAQQTGRHSLLQ